MSSTTLNSKVPSLSKAQAVPPSWKDLGKLANDTLTKDM
jgi:hypothetical protein